MRKNMAYLILRVGLGIVFLLFGIGKLQGDLWAETMKTMNCFVSLPWSVNISILIIGLLEVVTGVCLILGLFTRFFATFSSLLLIGILILFRFEEIRDIGLLGAALFLALIRNDVFGIDWLLAKRKRS